MWTSELAEHFVRFCGSTKDTLHIVCPFIRLDALKAILHDSSARDTIVVTTWNPEDISQGYSDMAIYPWLRERGGYLYVNNSLHAKVLVQDYSRGILSTANITGAALGLSNRNNIEAAVEIPKLSNQNLYWLHQIILQSVFVQDSYYLALLAFVGNIAPKESTDNTSFDNRGFGSQTQFLLSNLPQCSSPAALIEQISQLSKQTSLSDETELQCVLHDMALFNVQLDDPINIIKDKLRSGFLSHPFIFSLKDFISDKRYFGEVKEWLQSTCTNVPVPRRKDLTVHVQTLLEWLAELDSENFVVSRPNYSQCIQRQSH
jgi:hypothetical protein